MAKPNIKGQYVVNHDLIVRMHDEGQVVFELDREEFFYPAHVLSILEIFVKPMSLRSAIESIQTSGIPSWVEKTSTLNSLIQQGFLIEEGNNEKIVKASPSYGSATLHIKMLNDRLRTSGYLKAIHETVREGDVVVDIGTGSGILAVAAAKAGAKKVYAIEINPVIADVARQVVSANALQERVQVIQGWSTEVDLPQKVDVVVSEMLGHDPFNEDILGLFADAKRRFTKQECRFIPEQLSLFCVPLNIDSVELEKYVVSQDIAQVWQKSYGIDLSPLGDIFYPDHRPLFFERPHKFSKCQILSKPVFLGAVNLNTDLAQNPEFEVSLSVEEEGLINTLMLCFEAKLSSETTLSLLPDKSDSYNHWKMPVWYLNKTVDLKELSGQKLCYERYGRLYNRLYIEE